MGAHGAGVPMTREQVEVAGVEMAMRGTSEGRVRAPIAEAPAVGACVLSKFGPRRVYEKR